ncbi:ABC transporter permease [Epibacterium sp. Ofav1-8]|uniref:ABC transporter permease n=1 Tax=Epibacterium sp. Ofav1-8 TaxID=2917735 RepID=UPI001EF65230|nr:FtsX-like permease family protein [Epibacterium sp. Ofav1-8]MCG7622234.1 ABC transporter permease [Epibacterium sp. Ofav1-8]
MRLSPSLLIRQNLTRKLLRSVLLILCIGVAFFIFGVLSSFRQGFEGAGSQTARLVVASKVGGNETLPLSYLPEIEALDDVAEVTHITRLRAFVGNERNIVGANAVDLESYARVYADTYNFTPDMLRAAEADRTAILVGRTLADRMGWHTGDSVTLTSFVHARDGGDRNWRFTIAGIFDGAEITTDTSFLLARSDYFHAAVLRNRNRVDLYGIKPQPGADTDALSRQIDAAYANSGAQTRTQSETAFMSAFLEQFANIALLVRLIVGVAFATILMIVANTMIFAIRERTLEIGVLKVLGFSGGRIMRIVLAETLVLFALGLCLGLSLTAAVIPMLADALQSVVPGLYLTPRVIGTAVALAVGFALACGALPSINALRLPIAAALKHR